MDAFAHPLPVIVISELIGVPVEDQNLFIAWSQEMARGIDPDFLQTPSGCCGGTRPSGSSTATSVSSSPPAATSPPRTC